MPEPYPPFLYKTKDAYLELAGYYPPQSWFAFDKSVTEVRKRGAERFVMTVWNQRPGLPDPKAGFVEDSDSLECWYRIPRTWSDKEPKKRTALFNAIRLARELGIPMTAMLKDHTSGRVSLEHVFNISDVAYEPDGSMAWLKLENDGRPTGTTAASAPLARLRDLPRQDPLGPKSPLKRKAEISLQQIEIACAIGRRIFSGELSQRIGLIELVAAGYEKPTAGVALRNYAHLRRGEIFSSLMSVQAVRYFVRSILVDDGIAALPRVLFSLHGHAASVKAGPTPALLSYISELEQQELLGSIQRAAAELAKQERLAGLASEIQRLIWSRGPHHKAFREMLEVRWNSCCAVHGTDCTQLLRASHIIPWSESTDEGRADPNNGLLLSVPLDGLFDRGLISFDDDGQLLTGGHTPNGMLKHYGITPGLRLRWEELTEGDQRSLRKNLAAHRSKHDF